LRNAILSIDRKTETAYFSNHDLECFSCPNPEFSMLCTHTLIQFYPYEQTLQTVISVAEICSVQYTPSHQYTNYPVCSKSTHHVRAFRTLCLLSSLNPAISLYARNMRTAGSIFMKFDMGEYYEKLSCHFNLHLDENFNDHFT
jgi:hypothetical protein